MELRLNWKQKLSLIFTGYARIGWRMGHAGHELDYYVGICPEHGLQIDYNHGRPDKVRIYCQECRNRI